MTQLRELSIPEVFVASGEAELAIQQVSELMVVPGLGILGWLPPGIEGIFVFTAALFVGRRRRRRT